MAWLNDIQLFKPNLIPPANLADVRRVEHAIGVMFPDDFREFLLTADGGDLNDGHFVIYSAGGGRHPDETLIAANRSRPIDFPIVAIGADAMEEFGFRKSDLEIQCVGCPVFFNFAETDELTRMAPTFRAFIVKLSRLRPGEALQPE